MQKEMVSFSISEDLFYQISSYYSQFQERNNGEYIVFFARFKGLTITIYQSKKGYTIVFNGINALNEAKIWNNEAKVITPKNKVKEEWLSLNDQIGSDEVGVVDLFLPMVVVASYVSKDDYYDLLNYKIHDSKKLDDQYILTIGPTLIKKFQVAKLTLHNDKYNEMISKGENLNSLKAKMHNKALLTLKKKHPKVNEIYIDEFCKEETYYSYLSEEDNPLYGVTFKTKGESFYPSVALASVIARYSFLLEKKKLEEKYKLEFPLGSGKKADQFIITFVNKYGLDELKKITKRNFSNLKRVIDFINSSKNQ